MRSSLTERLRRIVTGASVSPDGTERVELGGQINHGCAVAAGSRAAACLGGAWHEGEQGAFILVERFYPADARYGRVTIGSITERLLAGRDALALLGRAWPSSHGASEKCDGGLLFLDLETTGLAGGAGTQAFLVGCASVEHGGVRTRQYLLPGFEHERALLSEIASWSARPGALVTFNGRTFDVPLIETRFLFHRLEFPLAAWPHLDMLHPARRLWKARPAVVGPPLDDESCRLCVLERHLAGVHRVGDVPGFEIPSRFFSFIRDGDARPLHAVLEHNRLDLLSLALVTAHAFTLIERGPAVTAHGHECVGLGRLFERAGAVEEAEACYSHAADSAARIRHEPALHAEALRRLALCRRRAGRPREAALAWAELAELPGTPAAIRREAREALAIHYEHRLKDLDTAHLLALDVLTGEQEEKRRRAAQHRLGRIERKRLHRSRSLIAAMEA